MLLLDELNAKLQEKSFHDIFTEKLLQTPLSEMNKLMRELAKINYAALSPENQKTYDHFYTLCEQLRDAIVCGKISLAPSLLEGITGVAHLNTFGLNPFTDIYAKAHLLYNSTLHKDFDACSEQVLLNFYKSRLDYYGTAEKARQGDGAVFIALEEYIEKRLGKDVHVWLSN
jgi:hypothetical protein